jgi:hypothetical protein
VSCCVVLCRAVSCCVVLCRAVSCCVVLCRAVPPHLTPTVILMFIAANSAARYLQ